MRQNLQDAAKSLAVYVLPLKASREFIPKIERSAKRASRINEDDLSRVILSDGGRSTDHAAAISLPRFPNTGMKHLLGEHLLGATIEKPACLRILHPIGISEIDIVSETMTYHSRLLQSIWSENHGMRAQSGHNPFHITTYQFDPTGHFLTQISRKQLATTPCKLSAPISRESRVIIGLKVLHHQEPAESQQVLAVKVKSMKYLRRARLETGLVENWQCEDIKGWILNSKATGHLSMQRGMGTNSVSKHNSTTFLGPQSTTSLAGTGP